MRYLLLYFALVLVCGASAQIALDDLFIRERWLLNSEASLLDHHGVDHALVHAHAEHIHTYALDEPYYWEKRVFLRIDPKENPALAEESVADSIRPFVDIVNAAIAAGEITVFNDLDYVGADAARGTEPIAPAPIILKVDFHIDTLTRRAVPHIVGLSVERPGGGYAHFYYPELNYALLPYRVRTTRGLIPLDAYFKEFRIKATWLDCGKVASTFACEPTQPSWEQQSELDALTELFLLERVLERDGVIRRGKRSLKLDLHPFPGVRAYVEFDPAGRLAEAEVKNGHQRISIMHFDDGVPHGPYRAFFPDGHLREEGVFDHGLRTGNWNSWYPGGSIRSHWNYARGQLEGQQQVYHPNGQLWLQYGMERGEYEGDHKTWYPDGELKASGTMHEGFVRGVWDYAIRIDRTLMQELDMNNATLYHLPDGSWQDGVLRYHATVTDDGRPGNNTCLLGRCIQWTFSDIR